MPTFDQQTAHEQNRHMESYYQWQSRIYDATRWSFLFGRQGILRAIPYDRDQPWRIAEIGCGTGFNLIRLARRFPQAQLTGMDVSPDMIRLSQKCTRSVANRVTLLQQPYQKGQKTFEQPLDAIVFSYSLTMINPQWSSLLEQARADLRPGGIIAVADFHDSRFSWFKKHMSNHHVRMDGHLLPKLETLFRVRSAQVKPAYGGVWHYLMFIGERT